MSQSDQLVRFLFREKDVRGEIVQVAASLDLMLQNHQYAQPVKQLLAELVAATSLLTATLKFEGQIAVQIQGDGPVKFAAVNGNNKQQFRGVVRMQSEVTGDSFLELIGQGFLLVTITPDQGERYQGVIPVTGNSLSETLEAYFNQSEQLPTRIYLHTDIGEVHNKAAGLLLQVLPVDQDKAKHDFAELEQLTDTITAEELLTLAPEDMLYRLFHQEVVELFPAQKVEFVCGCSRDKCEAAIISLGQAAIEEHIAEGKLDISCEYCNTTYHFDSNALIQLARKF
ncbi:MAG TPA: Hsp33 family molecular chaperone HslO [Rheinheimera sp.]|uniref:Hsp33 family molecular chaperone HslO n=1 Tax=Rheinheimera sp. TaxID=1869214 RepID=UPI000EDA7525|nr:Hsp33 family molecular chaperone HslO [Rheinheimera sp.]HCU65825.1 Hsp33 family molecular chaperone HslO [Rheinheimera sp.]